MAQLSLFSTEPAPLTWWVDEGPDTYLQARGCVVLGRLLAPRPWRDSTWLVHIPTGPGGNFDSFRSHSFPGTEEGREEARRWLLAETAQEARFHDRDWGGCLPSSRV